MKQKLFLLLFLFIGMATANASINKNGNLQTDTLKKGKNYILFNKSANIDEVSFSVNKKKESTLVIRYGYPNPGAPTNNINGAIQQSKTQYGEPEAIPVFDKIEIVSGKYENIKVEKENTLRNRFTFTDLQFPLHLKLTSGKETIEFELQEAGYWNMAIMLKKNN
ncbi:hypothetical protein VRU48_09380 [Pedobacter sp. KR3-3]|uniref:DUF2911 domain-containing protein n=1 Tax=Pedobacter albus TaxID=3113905 RepID=A0ABU7I7G1_9SPHI|nr:hypothetical protein [Pedobacter sp. KR3-3]MEE1945319.1 hypothetical protein [Pedobacter sp. KR3-3]